MPFSLPNVRLFLAFRVLFNARLYYPVFTVLFLDLGLTLDQFALLNVAWAASIVLLEVPSGALADLIGRRNLLVSAALLMIGEMLLLAFAPAHHPALLPLLLLNRILSGAAEASASGADEALAYDTLQAAGLASHWDAVQSRLMLLQSAALIGAMSLGSALYDPAAWRLLLGLDLPASFTLRLPLYATLLLACAALVVTLRMKEIKPPAAPGDPDPALPGADRMSVRRAFALVLQAGQWILRTPLALGAILAGLLFDSFIRIALTLNSQYYRQIGLPEAAFGLVAAALGLVGFLVSPLARHLSDRWHRAAQLALLAALTFGSLLLMSHLLPVIGLLPIIGLYAVIQLSSFLLSGILNRLADSSRRATVLSFRGLSFNLAYGVAGLLYSLLVARLRAPLAATGLTGPALENTVFASSLAWLPCTFLLLLIPLALYLLHLRRLPQP